VNANVIGKAGNFNICFREASMSSHSGLLLFHEFVKSLSVAELIDENLKVKRKERGYSESGSIMVLVYNMVIGGSCLSDLNVLRGDCGSKQLLQMEEIISPPTSGEFLRKFTDSEIKDFDHIISKLQEKVRPKQSSRCCTIDIDGVVLINDAPEDFLPVRGKFVNVKITAAHEYDLVGRIIEKAI
jgi:hypothetical protein